MVKYEELGLSNDFMFGKIMRDEKICKPFLERLLGFKIHHIEYLEPQKAVDLKPDAKSVRFDIYVDDGGTVYDCEMQTTSQKELPKRSRYYQGQIDMNLINRGESYRKLKRSFVIFICTFDPFGKGSWVYRFENVCREFPELLLKDGAVKIFFNTHGINDVVSEEVKDLLRYLETSVKPKAKDPLLEDMKQALQSARTNKEWRHDYMTLQVLLDDKKEEGIKETQEMTVRNMLQEGFEIPTIARITGLTADDIEKIRKNSIECP